MKAVRRLPTGRDDARQETMKLATDSGDTTSNTFFLCTSHTTTAYRFVSAEEYLPHEKATPGGLVIATSVLKRKHVERVRRRGHVFCDRILCHEVFCFKRGS